MEVKLEEVEMKVKRKDYLRWAVTLAAASIMSNKRERMICLALKRTLRGIENDKY